MPAAVSVVFSVVFDRFGGGGGGEGRGDKVGASDTSLETTATVEEAGDSAHPVDEDT